MSITGEISLAKAPAVVRPATVDDSDAIFALAQQLGLNDPPERASFDRAISGALTESDDHILLVSEADGTVVGYALVTIARLLYTNGESAQLQELVVASSETGHGYGGQLVSAVERECRARGVGQLTVASILRAASFYERLDYRSTADYLKKSFRDQ
jgi:GNAT superfamily N-acetyltransferase